MKDFVQIIPLFVLLSLTGCTTKSSYLDKIEPIKESFTEGQTAQYRAISWSDLPNWKKDNHLEALESFKNSCEVMKSDPKWQKVCLEADEESPSDPVSARIFFQRHFLPYEVVADGKKTAGVITGYYLPVLNASRTKSAKYRYAIYKKPADLVVVEADKFGRGKSFRGRITPDQKIVPYYTRAEIDSNEAPLKGDEIVWVDDDIALFFLHIQGSGFAQLESGEMVQINYDGQNGHKYHAIGKTLIEEGKIAKEEISLQSIRSYLLNHPEDKKRILNSNPSYIFFKEGDKTKGVLGTQGARLTNGRSVAVDRGFIDLGSPIFIEFTHPTSSQKISRLTVAQDTGGAIKGAVRVDYFWGDDLDAEINAGNMKSMGKIWLLIPKENL